MEFKIHTYNEFLNEAVLNNFKDSNEILNNIIQTAKKQKLIDKSYNGKGNYNTTPPKWITDIYDYRDTNTHYNYWKFKFFVGSYEKPVACLINNTYCEIRVSDDNINNSEHLSFYIKSDKEIKPEILEKIFEKNFNFISFTNMINCTRNDIEGNFYNRQVYTTTIEYDIIRSDNSRIEVESIKKLPEFKNLTEECQIAFVSSKAQINHSTLVFAVPTNLAICSDESYRHWFRPNFKYGSFFYALYPSGDIRLLQNDEFNKVIGHNGKPRRISSPTRVARFDSSSLEGWANGLEKIKSLLVKKQKTLEKQGILFFLSKEELHHNRGKINGNKYGI